MKKPPNIIAIDTSTRWYFIGLLALHDDGARLLESTSAAIPNVDDGWLRKSYDQFLKDTSLKSPDYLAIGRGPGSFTGLRVGFSFARALAMLLNKPLLNFPSLLFWRRALQVANDELMLVRVNRSLYYGHYLSEGKWKHEALSWQEWQKRLSEGGGLAAAVWEATWAGFARSPVDWPKAVRQLDVDEAAFASVPLPDTAEMTKASVESWQGQYPEYGHQLTYIKNL